MKPIPFREVDNRAKDARTLVAMEDEIAALRRKVKSLQGQPPYPWCIGMPTGDKTACIEAGYCRRNPSCGD